MALVSFPGGSAAPYDPEPDEDPEDEGLAGKMSFLDHLEELRKRIIISLVAIIVGFLIAFLFIDRIYNFVMGPLARVLPGHKLIYTEPTEALMLYMKAGALAGLFMALPVILYQLWRFVAPGLYAHERKFAIPFVFFATFFFVAGAAFSHYMVFPWAWEFFASFGGENLEFLPRIEPVFSLYLRMLLAMGLVFEMPTLVFFLARIGLVTPGMLIKNTKYAILVIFIVAAILTPGTDMVSQALMAGPMIVLYILSIGIAWAFQKRTNA
jgi:sec-independent protein translocase protein TatC